MTEHILWLDLEMTGLNPSADLIIEVAAIVTDWDFKEIATFESGVGHDVARVSTLLDANPFYTKMKENKASLLQLTSGSAPSLVVEGQLIEFVKKHCDTARPVVLAGNSIHIDRQYIREAWPSFDQLLHYRMLDVTAWKIVFENKYNFKYSKQEKHRALEDVRESIAELQVYMDYAK